MRLTTHFHLALRLGPNGHVIPLPLYAFMADTGTTLIMWQKMTILLTLLSLYALSDSIIHE